MWECVGWEFELPTVHQKEVLIGSRKEKYYKYFEKVGKNS